MKFKKSGKGLLTLQVTEVRSKAVGLTCCRAGEGRKAESVRENMFCLMAQHYLVVMVSVLVPCT